MLSYLFRNFGNEYKAVVVNEEAVQNLQRWKRSDSKSGFFPVCVQDGAVWVCDDGNSLSISMPSPTARLPRVLPNSFPSLLPF